jgi:hypothetical protein
VRLGLRQQDGDLARGKELFDALGKGARTGRSLVELAVEVVEKPADGLGVGGLRAAYGLAAGSVDVRLARSTRR